MHDKDERAKNTGNTAETSVRAARRNCYCTGHENNAMTNKTYTSLKRYREFQTEMTYQLVRCCGRWYWKQQVGLNQEDRSICNLSWAYSINTVVVNVQQNRFRGVVLRRLYDVRCSLDILRCVLLCWIREKGQRWAVIRQFILVQGRFLEEIWQILYKCGVVTQ